MEENFRHLDRQARVQISTWEGTKGDLPARIFGDRDAIAESDQGRSFKAFYDLLMSTDRQDELTGDALQAEIVSLGSRRSNLPAPIVALRERLCASLGIDGDTLPFAGPLALLSFLLPIETLTASLAGLLQAYIVEEWVHHSVHFYRFRGRYFRYIKRHHLYHHSPKGMNVAYGLSNGFWDIVYGTRISIPIRRALYERKAARRASSQAV